MENTFFAIEGSSNNKYIDLRSDTVTQPTKEMIQYMSDNAHLTGDDVFGEDTLVNQLQEKICKLTGKEAALFVPTGTMSNQIGLKCLLLNNTNECLYQSIICDERAHIYASELGGVSVHSQTRHTAITPDPVKNHITAEQIEGKINLENDYHKVVTTIISLENTIIGQIVPFGEVKKIKVLADKYGIRLHLDGARLWNVAVETGIPLKEWCDLFETVSLCFSKGLGAPVGSILVSTKKNIDRARQIRKSFGGGMRQCGLFASACIYAVDNHFERLKNDHLNAKRLYEGLTKIGINIVKPDTNVLLLDSSSLGVDGTSLQNLLKESYNIKIPVGKKFRLVLHLQIKEKDIEYIISSFEKAIKHLKENK